MTRTSTLFFFCLLIFHGALSQDRPVTGTLTDENGLPLPGVTITLKGTETGTITDEHGNYSINAHVGDVLVFSFIGFKAKEMTVTADHFKKGANAKKPNEKKLAPFPTQSLFRDSAVANQPGMSFLSNSTPHFRYQHDVPSVFLKSIRKRGHNYIIKSYEPNPSAHVLSALFTTAVTFERINKLPLLQSDYAQGRPSGGSPQWQGADQHEIFSWGPLVRTLEYDGSAYDYDPNGKLVKAGIGNGTPANRYDPFRIFKTGVTLSTELSVTYPAFNRGGMLVLDIDRKTRQGVIPNTRYERNNFSFKLVDLKLAPSTWLTAAASYHTSEADLPSRGANLATIIGSVYQTPVTFDNKNGLTTHDKQAYLLADGSPRTFAPGVFENPYGLINQLPDHEKQDRFLSRVSMKSTADHASIVADVDFDHQNNFILHGFPIGYAAYPAGRLTSRTEVQDYVHFNLAPSYRTHAQEWGELKVTANYSAGYTGRNLDRRDGYQFLENSYTLSKADSSRSLHAHLSRFVQETALNLIWDYKGLLVKAGNRNYFSNTVNQKSFTNLFPSASLSYNLLNNYGGEFYKLQPYLSASRTIREAPLIYSNWSYGTTRMAVSDYTNFYEATELFFDKSLRPEIENKFETGIGLGYRQATLDIAYYNNLTSDFITPVWQSDHFAMSNAATVRNTGLTVDLSISNYFNGDLRVRNDLKWTTYNNTTEKLNSADPYIAIAGFGSIATVLAPGKPVGAIYGTSLQRNANNEVVIGNDGFPLVNTSMKMIGNPIPNWTAGWSSYFSYRKYNLSFVFEYKNGGQAWNGTGRMLDYLGRSANTGSERSTRQYVFKGVDATGNINSQAVDFANPVQPVGSNRWVRYGVAGVGEEYIQNTSWFRLTELTLGYRISLEQHKTPVRALSVALVGRNIFLITPYKGVDPSTSLFGYTSGVGLDLFNTPSVRSVSAKITLKF